MQHALEDEQYAARMAEVEGRSLCLRKAIQLRWDQVAAARKVMVEQQAKERAHRQQAAALEKKQDLIERERQALIIKATADRLRKRAGENGSSRPSSRARTSSTKSPRRSSAAALPADPDSWAMRDDRFPATASSDGSAGGVRSRHSRSRAHRKDGQAVAGATSASASDSSLPRKVSAKSSVRHVPFLGDAGVAAII